jgi:hypothetical protein
MRPSWFGEPLTLKSKNVGQLVTIPAKSVFDSHQTLGHHKAPARDINWQQDVRCHKSDAYAKTVLTSSCNQWDSWFFYQAIYLKSIWYVLPNCFFNKKVLMKVQQGALQAFLSKCGFNRNTKRAVMFAPWQCSGGGFMPLYLLQGEGQILSFLKHWRTDTPAGRLLRIATS